ncbi:serine hydrolase [Yimella sp. cx-573]|nr:serine hydrolase [Yimella sp. cx-573]
MRTKLFRRRLVAAMVAPVLLTGCSTGHRDDVPASSSASSSSVTRSPIAPTRAPAVTTAPGVRAADWSGVDAAARNVASKVALMAGVVTPSGQLQIVHRSGPQDAQPIASVIKLYVMVAVLDAIGSGALTWDRTLTVQRADIAAGSGTLGGRGVGTRITVREAARMMFQISDNTATSLLIRTLGQDALAKAVQASGHSRPELLKPFLTIREDLWLVYSGSRRAADARADWATADTATRARLVEPAHGAAGDEQLGAAHLAVGIGYWATTVDVARAWVAIATRVKTLGSRAGQSAAFMQVASGPFDRPSGWKTVWFKSGSIGAAQNGAWYTPGDQSDQVLVVLTTGGSEAGVRGFASTAAAQLDRYAQSHR